MRPSFEPPRPVQPGSLSWQGLRRYRDELHAEDDRISYWRRVLHGRIDVLTAQASRESPLDHVKLVRALADTGSGQRRRGLMRVAAVAPLPELPTLTEVWTQDVDPADAAAVEAAVDRLRADADQLSRYRQSLHQRIDEITGELITRYREDPTLAIELLRERTGRAG